MPHSKPDLAGTLPGGNASALETTGTNHVIWAQTLTAALGSLAVPGATFKFAVIGVGLNTEPVSVSAKDAAGTIGRISGLTTRGCNQNSTHNRRQHLHGDDSSYVPPHTMGPDWTMAASAGQA